MRQQILLLSVLTLIGAGLSTASARQSGDQGYGIMLGNPSGLSGKVWLDNHIAIDGAVGVARSEFDIHLSLLMHDYELLRRLKLQSPSSPAVLPFYFGIGPRVLFEDKTEFGIRFPVGVSYFPDQTSWEFFGELAPVIRLTPSTGFNGDFAIGLRYYFNTLTPRTR